MALKVELREDRIFIGERFSVGFQRTLRIPEDGQVYPLPPGLGLFTLHQIDDYAQRVPASWRERDGYFIALYQREALWLGFGGASWKPNAVKIGAGNINAVSGDEWDENLRDDPQDYLVCPMQLWLDGINAGEGYIRQFVAMPLGGEYTIESQISTKGASGGIQILVLEPKPGRFPDEPPPRNSTELAAMFSLAGSPSAGEMGLAAGGKIKQKIYPDPYGIDTWDSENRGSVLVRIVNSEHYSRLTGRKPPLTPISAQTYTDRGFPWFDLYDEAAGDVEGAPRLAAVKSVKEIESAEGIFRAQEGGREVPATQIKKLRIPDGEKG
jgi:hypothetical protein